MAEIMESIYRNFVFEAVRNGCKTKSDVRTYVYSKIDEEIGSNLVFESLLDFHYSLTLESKEELG